MSSTTTRACGSTVDRHGKVTLRYESKLHHIGMGARHKNRAVVMLIADRDIRVVTAEDGELLRHLTLDPKRDYQPQTLGLAV